MNETLDFLLMIGLSVALGHLWSVLCLAPAFKSESKAIWSLALIGFVLVMSFVVVCQGKISTIMRALNL